MTVQEVYEELREGSKKSAYEWDDLDYASDFCDDASDACGNFLPWHELPAALQAVFTERLAPWVERRNKEV